MTDLTPTQDTITAQLEDLLARATADDDDHMVAGPDNILWLMTQLACWPIRVDLDCTTNDRFLRFSAVATMQALLSERATLEAELEEARGVLADAPEPYEYMSKAAFKSLPTPMRSFVDAHKTWMSKARAYLTREPTNGR